MNREHLVGPHTTILALLQRYGEVEPGFLASRMAITERELRGYLDTLEQLGVIKTAMGEHVELASHD